jgi:hypothetical protein
MPNEEKKGINRVSNAMRNDGGCEIATRRKVRCWTVAPNGKAVNFVLLYAFNSFLRRTLVAYCCNQHSHNFASFDRPSAGFLRATAIYHPMTFLVGMRLQ